jgi:hypothetical protein
MSELDFMLKRYVTADLFLGMSVIGADDLFSPQTAPKAIAFYDDKVKGLEANLQELEKIVQTKSSQLRIVEESEFAPFRTRDFYCRTRPFFRFLTSVLQH